MSNGTLTVLADTVLIQGLNAFEVKTSRGYGLDRNADPYVYIKARLPDNTFIALSTLAYCSKPRILILANPDQGVDETHINLANHPNFIPNQNAVLAWADQVVQQTRINDMQLLKSGKASITTDYNFPEMAAYMIETGQKAFKNEIRLEAGLGTAYALVTISETFVSSENIEDRFSFVLEYAYIDENGQRVCDCIDRWDGNLPEVFQLYENDFKLRIVETIKLIFAQAAAEQSVKEESPRAVYRKLADGTSQAIGQTILPPLQIAGLSLES